MRKKYFKSAAIYLLFFANSVYACMHRQFGWLFWTAAALTLACFVLDVLEVFLHGRT